MNLKLYPYLSFFYLFFCTGNLSAQAPPADTTFLSLSIQEAHRIYKQGLGKQVSLYNGPEYFNYRKSHFEGHQFFEADKAVTGSVFYDGSWYDQVPLFYDVVYDELILSHGAHNNITQKLIKERVQRFTLLDHTFVHFKEEEVKGSLLSAGYYDILYVGNIKFIAKRVKIIEERIEGRELKGEFKMNDKLYLAKENKFYPVKSKRSVYRVLGDKKKELQGFMRAGKLKYRLNREAAIIQLAAYYDSLQK